MKKLIRNAVAKPLIASLIVGTGVMQLVVLCTPAKARVEFNRWQY
jgi:hypothetical protein